jgi:hypothetical protein
MIWGRWGRYGEDKFVHLPHSKAAETLFFLLLWGRWEDKYRGQKSNRDIPPLELKEGFIKEPGRYLPHSKNGIFSLSCQWVSLGKMHLPHLPHLPHFSTVDRCRRPQCHRRNPPRPTGAFGVCAPADSVQRRKLSRPSTYPPTPFTCIHGLRSALSVDPIKNPFRASSFSAPLHPQN